MHLKYRVVFLITFLLLLLSLTLSVVNYALSYQALQQQLKERSLPLTVDNIYTEIQKHIIEPNLVSSMMAHDTFMKDWLQHHESDSGQIARYLETVKNKYGMFTTFLVSEKTLNYYTAEGFMEKVREDRPDNKWYFAFKKVANNHEINLDYNAKIDSSLIMFINHKIFDDEFRMIGATGVGLKISYVDDMLKRFRQLYHFNVYFLSEDGSVKLSERNVNTMSHINEVPELAAIQPDLIGKQSKVLEYTRQGESYLINTKYVPELDLYLIVEARLNYFTKDVNRTFYFNLGASLLATVVIALIILLTVRNYHRRLEHLASNDALTGLANRRTFNERLKQFFLLGKRFRKPMVLLFFDIDDFKQINDSQGHHNGDLVLQRIAEILRQHTRETDLIARWGGEEFVIALMDTGLKHAETVAEKLRSAFENDTVMQQCAKREVTASFGLTELRERDSLDVLLRRVDKALYEAKELGKNRISVH